MPKYVPKYVIENPEESPAAEETNTEVQQEEKAAHGSEQPEESQISEETAKEESQEQEYEIEGKKLKASELKALIEKAENADNAIAEATRKNQETAEERRRLGELSVIAERLKAQPELLGQLFQPKPTRDYDREIAEHYGKKPDPQVDPQAFVNWEYQKDLLLAERQEARTEERMAAKLREEDARRANDILYEKGVAEYLSKGLVNQDEFMQMQLWVRDNILARNGKYPSNSFDIAYAANYGDRRLSQEKLKTVKNIITSQDKAKPATGIKGSVKTEEKELSERESSFIEEMRARNKK